MMYITKDYVRLNWYVEIDDINLRFFVRHIRYSNFSIE